MQEYKKICVGIPHTGMFHWQTLTSLLSLKAPKNAQIVYHLIGSCLVYDAREKIVEFARNKGCEYVVMLDSDMVPPPDMLDKMFYHLENDNNIDMITGMAFKRTPPFQPCFYTKLQYNMKDFKPYLESPIEWNDNGGLMEIAGAGLACSMIRMSLFDKISTPYFFPLPNLGEDLTFCLKAKKEAKAVFLVDTSIDVGHCSVIPIHHEHFKACYEEQKTNGNTKTMFTDAEQEIDKAEVGGQS